MSMPGVWEFAVIGVLALLIFGPEKLPQMARSAAKTVSSFKREAQTAMDELKRSADIKDIADAASDLRSTGRDLQQQFNVTGTGETNGRSRRRGAGGAAATPAAPQGGDVDGGSTPYDPYAT